MCLERHITQKEKMTYVDSHCFHMMPMVTMEAFNGYWNGTSLKGNASQKTWNAHVGFRILHERSS